MTYVHANSRDRAAKERQANEAWTTAKAIARENGASREDAERAGFRAAQYVLVGWGKAQRSYRLTRDRWERCRQRWEGRTPYLRVG